MDMKSSNLYPEWIVFITGCLGKTKNTFDVSLYDEQLQQIQNSK